MTCPSYSHVLPLMRGAPPCPTPRWPCPAATPFTPCVLRAAHQRAASLFVPCVLPWAPPPPYRYESCAFPCMVTSQRNVCARRRTPAEKLFGKGASRQKRLGQTDSWVMSVVRAAGAESLCIGPVHIISSGMCCSTHELAPHGFAFRHPACSDAARRAGAVRTTCTRSFHATFWNCASHSSRCFR